MQLLCLCRCWSCTCRPIPRCTAERRSKSPETRSTRTCCSIPDSNTCTSPPRKRSNSLTLGQIDSFFFIKSISRSFHPSNTSVSLREEGQGLSHVLTLLLSFHPSRQRLNESFIYLIWSFIHLYDWRQYIRLHYHTEVSHWFIHSLSFSLFSSLVLFLPSSVSLSLVLSSFGCHHSPPPHRSEIDVIDSEMN